MSGMVHDKRGLLEHPYGARLDLGCGSRKLAPDYIGVDLLDHPDVDVVGDVLSVLSTLPDRSLGRVYSSHFFEHFDDTDRLLAELGRTMATGAELEVIVPHFANPYFYSDPTHRRAFGLYSFAYYVSRTPLRRRVPTYGRDMPFKLEATSLLFKSAPPFYARHAFKRLVQRLANLSTWCQEFYEENLCYLVPCYEIRFVMVRV